ncbi:MAG TPA: galactokinase [Gaiellaceae bacterium]|jgi:galactokinase
MREARAPGRVNLIGDHTDYNEGFVLPAAIDLETRVRARSRGDALIRVRSLGSRVEIRGQEDPRTVEPAWGRYVAAVAGALAARGRPPIGMDADVSSTVPSGAGLSSSAALEVSVALALCDAAGFKLPPVELALACQEAEQVARGVPTGIMDQLSSIAGRAGCALLIDCRSLEVEPIPLPDELAIVVVHSGIERALEGSAYAERRADCERVAAALGVAALRDATLEHVADEPRARHVVSENARVLASVEALKRGDVDALGPLLDASHASLRDDFEVSTPELDALAEALRSAGALGARLTGAGFGGCVVALAPREDAERIAGEAVARYRDESGRKPRSWIVRAVDGARMEET